MWDPTKQNYNDWRFLVVMWCTASEREKLSKADRGYVLFQTLKDIQKDNIGSKLITAAQLGIIDVFNEQCVEQILAVLDKRFKEDYLALKKKAWNTFINLKREKEEEIDEYIDKYDEECANFRKAGRDLDDETYALKLMDSAKLADDLSQLVISGIDDKQPEIYDQTKKATRKYLGSERSGISIKERIKVKDEVFMLDNNENEQAYYNALPRQNSFYGRRRYSQNSQRCRRGRDDFRRSGNQYHRQWMKNTRSQSAVDSGNKNKRPLQLNPPDSDGKHKSVIFVDQFSILREGMVKTALNHMKIFRVFISQKKAQKKYNSVKNMN